MSQNQGNSQLFNKSNQLQLKEEVTALTGNMVASEEQCSWLVCKLTSQAQYRDVTIRDLQMQLNPEISDFIDIIDSVGCDTGYDDDDILCIEPGETYEVLFKIRVNKVKLAQSFIQDDNPGKQNTARTSDQAGSKANELQVADQLSLVKKLYALQQVE